jgi:DNA polymerase I-like protein with 3'-5' exonuclease and polymerase domains
MAKLSSHIERLRKEKALMPNKADDAIIFWGTGGSYGDKEWLPHLKGCVGSVTTFVRLEEVTTLTTVKMYCKQKGVTRIISTSISLLKKLLDWDKRAAPSLDNYSGSHFTIPCFDANDGVIEIVFIKPLKHLVTVPFGKFMAKRLVTKLTKPDTWYKPTPFNGFTLLTPANEADLFALMQNCFLVSIDIETLKDPARIRCLSYTGFGYFSSSTEIESRSVVFPLDSEYMISVMRKWNWELKAAKVGQNFKYDLTYLTAYSAPIYNYLYDTAHLMHCIYSELPKDLGFLNSFYIREAVYWKDLAQTNDLHEYYNYNALDTWGTGNCFLAMLLEAPEYAISNYLLEFPLVFPCHLSEMTGIDRDSVALDRAKAQQEAIIKKANDSLNTMLAVDAGTNFNVNSPIQMKALLKVLGCGDLKSADEKHLNKARFRHPFNARILNHVIAIRKARKLVSTYLTAGKEYSSPMGRGNRVLYSLNPHGTDTSRLASKEHAFWCGLNVQNIPRGKIVKQTMRADEGFHLCEVDLEQAESRDTGYISGDETLIDNVENSPDFHKTNASKFFGVPFDEITKDLRQLGKPVNHGANYNMGAFVLIDTMGEDKIVLAKQLLDLPRFWTYVQVAEHLLEQFHKVYPNIRKVFYAGVVEEVTKTNKLSSMAVHHSWKHAGKLHELMETAEANYAKEVGKAWVRYCFQDPTRSKPALNAYIAHPPQALNAQTLNHSYLSVFHDIAIHPERSRNFKLLAQIHDSIFFQYRIGHEYLCQMVVERMEVPVTIKAYDGVVRTFVVPAGAKRGLHLPQGYAKYWSETE